MPKQTIKMLNQYPSVAEHHNMTEACLSEEVDAVSDGVHGDGVSSNKEASKVDTRQVVELGVKASQLPDVVTDHVQ